MTPVLGQRLLGIIFQYDNSLSRATTPVSRLRLLILRLRLLLQGYDSCYKATTCGDCLIISFGFGFPSLTLVFTKTFVRHVNIDLFMETYIELYSPTLLRRQTFAIQKQTLLRY